MVVETWTQGMRDNEDKKKMVPFEKLSFNFKEVYTMKEKEQWVLRWHVGKVLI